MEVKELEGMSSSELLDLGGKAQQVAVEKMILERLEAKLPEIEKRIKERVEEAYASYCLSQLAVEKARVQTLQSQETSLKAERASLQQQLEMCQEERERLKDETAQQGEQLRKLQTAVKEHEQQRKGYELARQNKVSELLPFIRTETYEAYVSSLYSRDNIKLIYDSLRSDCGRGDTENLELYQRLINEYIELSRRITGKDAVQLQKVELGRQLFDSTRFDKTPRSPETGKISKVIYYGLERNGVVIDNCRSLVEVE